MKFVFGLYAVLLCFSGCINDYAYVNNLPTAPVFEGKKRVEALGSAGATHAQGSVSVRTYKNTGICLNGFTGFQGQYYWESALVQKFKIKNNNSFHLSVGYGQGHTNNILGEGFFVPLTKSETITRANYSQFFIQPYFSFIKTRNREETPSIWTLGAKLNVIDFSNYYVSYHRFSGSSYYNYEIAYSFPDLKTISGLVFINYTKRYRSGFSIQCNVGYNMMQKFAAPQNKRIFNNPYGNASELKKIDRHPFSEGFTCGISIGFAK